ncbi:nitrate- and nitrite sensing domain-containing protein [Shewanella sp. 10N.7]|uniref:nitrate- and nitrite sensing domain-containing protein n=1 Tax=Shewanella sp. 10N.7 TaxID=2885093 RepID=UPI001E286AA1|nr:nitrate- and nitrite sensing domain-containing protein [Shewanella sp. 10N.7]MCC4831410.1 nitrate- and nitrite sensing domain-containing protein [Shewanella sp. 10N.7]
MEIFVISSITLVLMMIIFLRIRKSNSTKKKQKNGLQYIQLLKNIITLVQQHRGISAAKLNGDTTAQEKLLILNRKIVAQVQQLKVPLLHQNERWLSFTDHWSRLTAQGKNMSVANSFEQHTVMIKNLCYLLEDIAEECYLTADHLPTLNHIGFVWRELVLATESIGQSRALGTGIAVKKACSSVEKIRLNFLITTMSDTTDNTFKQLSCLPEEQKNHQKLIEYATENVTTLITMIENELIKVDKVSVDNNHYFNLASDAIDKMNAIFEHQVKQLHTALS